MSIKTPDLSRGHIPKTLLVVTQPTELLTVTADGKDYTTTARPAYFIDADGATEKAIEWGVTWGHHEDDMHLPPFKRRRIEVQPETETIPNKPFTNLRLWTIDTRAKGGRAFKFIDEQGRLFDVREDVFLEAVHNGEVRSPGKCVFLTGQYIWVRVHASMRLARVNSITYTSLLEAGRRKDLTKIPMKELEVGTIYMKRDGEYEVYLGRARSNCGKLQHLCVSLRNSYYPHGPIGYQDRYEKYEAMTWQEKFEERLKKRSPYLSTTKAFIEKVSEVELMGREPQDIYEGTAKLVKVVNGKVVFDDEN